MSERNIASQFEGRDLSDNRNSLEITELIWKAENIDEVIGILMRIKGTIHGRTQDFDSERMIIRIERLRTGEGNLDDITTSWGLRDKVRELLPTDPVYLTALRKRS